VVTALLSGFFSVIFTLELIVVGRSLVAATTAASPSDCADYIPPLGGIDCQAGVEAPLPRAAPTPVVTPFGVASMAGTLVVMGHARMDGASFLDGDTFTVVIVRLLRMRAAGALAPGYTAAPRSQWPRLSACPLIEVRTSNWLPAQAWASSQRSR
jgi:hypothetical protein